MLELFAALFRAFRRVDRNDEFSRSSRDNTLWEMLTAVLFFGAGGALIVWMLFYWL
jgi:hypothetical protein